MYSQLYIVATPIGHIDDISIRAIETLKLVSIIAAEDTRQSKQLLKHYNINTPLIACHDHNEAQVISILIEKLQSGESIALISDAGTPLISDPGFKLVREAQRLNIPVTPIPGPCAAIAGLSAVGIPSDHFRFEGFLAAKSVQRRKQLESLKQQTHTMIFYEAPHRIVDCIQDMVDIFGADREVGFCREMTKTFETIKKLTLGELSLWVQQDPNQQKGEIVLIVAGAPKQDFENTLENTDHLLKRLLQDLSVKSAAQLAADLTGLKRGLLYQRALQLKQLGPQ